MSDRANSQKCFNDLLFEYRAQILPDVIQNWDNILDTEREAMTTINNLYCGMHFIVGMADYSSEALCLFEEASSDNITVSESGTI